MSTFFKYDNFAIMKKVAFYTLGCKLNFSETSTLSRMVESKGFQKVEFDDKPDIFIINTCSVTENADKKCRKIVRDALRINKDGYIAIIGCYAQLKPKEIAEIPGVNAVLGAAEKFQLPDLLETFHKRNEKVIMASEIEQIHDFHHSFSIHDRTRTFLKIQDGCDYSCSFCTIPLARGESRSDTIRNILLHVKQIAANKVKEIVLTGVNTGDFGIQNGKRSESFIDLAKTLDQVEGIERFRISSIEPNLLTDEIISFVSQSVKFVPHFHIPLQSGSDEILGLMRRRYQTSLYTSRINQIRKLMPNACVGVDVIAGFPGETNAHFLETYDYLNHLDVNYLHVFTYSERADTKAAVMENSVPVKIRNERSKMLRILSEKKRRLFYESQLGAELEVLFEHDIEDGRIHGFTPNYVRVSHLYNESLINSIQKVRLINISNNGTVDCVILLTADYSNRRASIGSSLEALNAG